MLTTYDVYKALSKQRETGILCHSLADVTRIKRIGNS